ncbi:MAG: glycosyltransferase family 39 protein [Lentimicrobium sp.]|nr:glycosyltransferase family 39 protein [Lentimicrobium sp.]
MSPRHFSPAVIFKIILFLNACMFVFGLWHRAPDIDDAWIGEPVWWMYKVGYAKSELMHGVTSQEVRSLVHHKLFSLNGLVSVKLFGFSLYSLKAVSLVWFVVFCVVLYRYMLKKFNKDLALFVLMLFTINAFVFQYGFVFRPEIMVMTLGFISWIFLERTLKYSSKRHLAVLLSGLFAGLAASGHLNGMIFMGAGGLLLLWNKRWIGSLIFAAGSLAGFAVYFYDFTPEFGFNYWLMQINNSPALFHSKVLPKSFSFLAKLWREHLRFFHSPREIALSLMVIFVLVSGYKLLYKSLKQEMRYLMLLAILLALLAVHSTGKYLLLYMPHLLIIAGLALQQLYHFRKKNVPLIGRFSSRQAWPWGLALAIVYIGINVGWNIVTASDKWNSQINRELSLKFTGDEAAKMKVVAPMHFIFNEIKHYDRIQADLSFGDLEKTGIDISGAEFIDLLNFYEINRLYLTPEYETKFEINNLPPLGSGQEAVTRLGEFNGLSIYKYNGTK